MEKITFRQLLFFHFIRNRFRATRLLQFVSGMLFLLSSLLNLEAAVVYTNLNPNQSFNVATNNSASNLIPLDFNNDGVPDFNFRYDDYGSGDWFAHVVPLGANEILWQSTATNPYGAHYAARLNLGDAITLNPAAPAVWGSGIPEPLIGDNNNVHFAGQGDKYIAVRFQNGMDYNYGWIKLSVSANAPYQVTVKGFAYETTVNTGLSISNNFINTSAQTLEFSAANSSVFYSCGAPKNYILKIRPQSVPLNGTLLLKIREANKGIYINNTASSNTSKIMIDLNQSTDKAIALVVQNLNVNEEAQITIPLFAGYCNLFGTNQTVISITDIFEFENNLPIVQNVNADVHKGPSLLMLDPANTAPTTIRNAEPDPGNNHLVTFQFAISNNSSKDFNGWVLFEEDETQLGNTFDIRNIKYYLYNPTTQTETLVSSIPNPVVNQAGTPNDNSFITINTFNSSVWVPNPNPKFVNVSIPAGHRLLIKEEVRINGCLVSPHDKSRPQITWGCGDFSRLRSYENCSVVNNYDTKIEGNTQANFSYVHERSNFYPTFICANDYRQTKWVTYKNTGNGIAYNTRLQLNNDNWTTYLVEKDPATIYIEIRRNGVTTRYVPNLTNFDLDPEIDGGTGTLKKYNTQADLPPDIYLPDDWLQDPNGNNMAPWLSYGFTGNYDINRAYKLKHYHEYFWGGPTYMQQLYDPTVVSAWNYSCVAPDPVAAGEVRLVYRLVIDEYWDPALNAYVKINLNPDDEVTLGWEEYKCCNSASNSNNLATSFYAPRVFIKYNSGCIPIEDYARSDRHYTLPTGNTGQHFHSQLKIDSYNPTSAGNVDRCSVTQDGMVERITSQFSEGLYISINHWQGESPDDPPGHDLHEDEPYQNWDGDIVFRVFLEQGLDLDKALSGAITSGFVSNNGYDNAVSNVLNVTNDPTGCNLNCVGCVTTDVITSPGGGTGIPSANYYIAIRKGSTVIYPVSVAMIDHSTELDPAVKSNNLRFRAADGSEQYAANLYEVRFRLSDLLAAAPVNNPNQLERDRLHDFMTSAFLDMDVRAYCAENSFPFFKIVSFLDKCDGQRTCDQQENGYTSMIPLSHVSGRFLVNCPGCKIPGANVNTGTLYRENMGFTDQNDDGVADDGSLLPNNHPNSRMIANGDVIVAEMSIAMSDGESKNGLDINGRSIGVLKNELDAANYNLDNLFVSVSLPGPSAWHGQEYTINPIEAEASIDGGVTWRPMTMFNHRLLGYVFLRINSRDFDANKASFTVSENIMVRFRGTMGWLTNQIDNYEITYRAGFSPCETCDEMTDFIEVNGTLNAGITGGGWPTNYISFDDLIQQDNTFFICTSFSNNFRYIPHFRDFYIENTNDRADYTTCAKDVWFIQRHRFPGYNTFKNEVRNGADTRILEFPIPAGYAVSQLYLRNEEFNDETQRYQYLNTGSTPPETSKWRKLYHEYYLPSSLFSTYSDLIQIVPTGNTNFPTKIILTLPSVTVPQIAAATSDPDAYDPLRYRQNPEVFQDEWISEVHPLVELDEYYDRRIRIRLAPIANVCLTENADIIYTDDNPETIVRSNLPWWTKHEPRNWYLEPLPSTADYNNLADGWWRTPPVREFNRFITPKANVNLEPAEFTSYAITNQSLVQIPVLVKLDYVAGTSNRYSAQYPFLHISGAAIEEGLILRGIYHGNKTISNQNIFAWYSYMSGTTRNWNWFGSNIVRRIDNDSDGVDDEYIIALDQYTWDILGLADREAYLNHHETYFTLVFSYECSSCNQLIASNCSDNSTTNTCLSGDNLQVAVGYNCVDFPTFDDIRDNNVCSYKGPEDFSISNLKVYVESTNYINDQEILPGFVADILPCQPFTYKVNINSCQNGGIGVLDIDLNLPAGYTATATTAGVTTLSDGTFRLSLASPICCGTTQDIEFTVTPPCVINPNDHIEAEVSALTYCGQTIDFAPVVTNLRLDNDLVNLGNAGITLDDISVASADITAGTGQLQVQYHVNSAATQYANDITVRISKGTFNVAYTCSIPAGTPVGTYTFYSDCSGSPIYLTPDCSQPYETDVLVKRSFVPPCAPQGQSCTNVLPDELLAQKSVIISSNIGLSLNTVTGNASFLCASSSVELKGTIYGGTAPVTYQWLFSPSTQAPYDPFTALTTPAVASSNEVVYSAVQTGTYQLVVTDANGCSNSRNGSVIDGLEAICPAPVCPGENPPLTLTNTSGVVGSFAAGWYRADDPEKNVVTSITQEGLYHAIAIPSIAVPACTLTTEGRPNWPCNIEFLDAPVAYQLTTPGPSGMCPGDTRIISVSNPGANPVLGNSDIVWTTGQLGTGDLIVTHHGTYYITATHPVTGCRTKSNKVSFYGPVIHINRECYEGNKVKLTASSNISAGGYTWTRINESDGSETPASVFNGNDNIIIVDNAGANPVGLYKVTNDVTDQCHTHRVIYEPLVLTAAPNLDIIPAGDGTFEGLEGPCSPRGFNTDFICNDVQPDDLDNPDDVINYNQLPGHYMIAYDVNPNPGSPEWWNRNYWTGTALSSDNFMIVDGVTSPNDQVIWQSTVNVQHGVKYLLRGNIRNIDVFTAFPPQEIPEIEARIIYRDASGSGIRHDIGRQILFNSGLGTNWIELSGLTSADAKVTLDNSRGEAVTAEITLIMKGGGALGRDIGVDNISLLPIGLCDDPTTIIDDRICAASFVNVDFEELHTCIGVGATFTAINSSGRTDLVYTWREIANGTSGTILSSTEVLAISNPTHTTSYDLTVTDPVNNCYFKRRVTLFVENPSLAIVSNATDNCLVNPIEFSVDGFTGIGGVSYQWLVNGVAVSGATSPLYTATLKNNDEVKCQLISGCTNLGGYPLTVYSNSITITGANVNGGPDVSICEGGNGTALDATGGVTYSWTPTAGLSDPAIANPVANPSATTVYTVEITDANGCMGADEVTVTVNPVPTPPTITPDPGAVVCDGQNVQFIINSPDATGIHVVSRPAGSIWLGGGWGGPGAIYETLRMNLPGGDYVASAVGEGGCLSAPSTLSMTVNANPDPTVITITPGTTVCAGTWVNVGVSFGTTDQHVFWSAPPLVNGGGGGGPGGFGFGGQAFTSGTFTSIKRNAAGCSTTVSIPFTVLPAEVPVVTASGATTFCEGGNVTLSTATMASSYQWNLNGTPISGATSSSYIVNASGSYTVTTNFANGCSTTSSAINVTVNPNLTPAVITVSPSTTVCEGTRMTIGVNHHGDGVTFTHPLTNTMGGGGPTGFGFSGDAVVSGEFLAIKVSAAGCSTATSVPLTVNPLPGPATIEIYQNGNIVSEVCAESEITMVLTSTDYPNAYPQLISRPAMNVISGTGFGNGYAEWGTVNTSGDFIVDNLSIHGCRTQSTYVLTVHPNPDPTIITVTPSTTVCEGSQVGVSVNHGTVDPLIFYSEPPLSHIGGGGGAGGWGFSAIANGSGEFVAIKRNAAGCSTTTTVPFTVIPAEVPVVTASGATTFCEGESVTLSTNAVATSYQWNLNGTAISGATTSSYVATAAGNYTVAVTYGNGCSRTSAATTVTVNANPAPTVITINPGTTVCAGTWVSVSVNFGTTDQHVFWSAPPLVNGGGGGGPGGFGFSGQAFTSGDFISIKRNAAGCSTTVTIPFTVTPDPLPAVPAITSSNTLICQGGSAQLSTTATGVSYQWRLNSVDIAGATASTYTATQAGSYSLRVTNAQGCFSISSGIALTSSTNPAPRVTVDPVNASLCGSQTQALNVGRSLQYSTNGYVNATGFNWPSGGAITIEFWTRVNTADVGNRSAFSIGAFDGNNRVQAHVPWSDNNLYWDYGNASGNGRVSTSFTNYLNKWTHVALVSAGNGGNFKGIYLDGVLVASSNAASDGPDVSLNGLLIGAFQSYYHRGMMDEFRIWNKVLNASEVQTAMNTQVQPGTANLVGCWRMDEASGTTVYDAVNSKNGTIVGGITRVHPTPSLTYTWTPSAGLNTTTGTSVIASAPASGSVVYTVRGTDANGCSKAATVTITRLACKQSVGDSEEDWSVDMYPNPASEEVNLQILDPESESVDLVLIDINGKVVYTDKVNTSDLHTFSIEDLPSGVYTVQIYNQKDVKTLRLVITR